MYQFLRALSASDLALRQAPAAAASFVVAALFYKWGSFALELIGFLGTWFVLDALAELATRVRPALTPGDAGPGGRGGATGD